jgi:hypothetical protein
MEIPRFIFKIKEEEDVFVQRKRERKNKQMFVGPIITRVFTNENKTENRKQNKTNSKHNNSDAVPTGK